MLTRFFDSVTRFSLRLNWLIVIFALGMFVLGYFSFRDLNQELVPRVEFPQTIVVAQWSEAEDAEDFLQQVTIPLEEKLRAVEGVVNVESTTNPAFAFIIVRNEFGLIQARIADEITTAIEGTALPETMEFPQVLSFSLTDLPIVTASISSSDLSLEELKALIQEDLLPEFESIDEVDQVAVSGGQVLPDETVAVEEDEIVVEAVPEPEPTLEPVPTVDPARLPDLLVQGLQAANIEVEFASDITPDLMRQLTAFGEQGTQGLALLTPGNLRALSPEVIALLPTTFVETLNGDLRAELDDVAADFGGAAALYEAELAAAAAAAADEVLTIEPVDLPESWVTALAAGGIEVQTTADLTPVIAGGLAEQAPELLADLEPAQWRALPPETLALLLPVAESDLEPNLVAQLRALLTVAEGGVVEPVELPAALAEGAAAAGLTLATTDDLTAELVGQLAGFAPQVFDELTPEMLYALAPEALAALPDEYLQSLNEDVRQTVGNLVVYGTAPVSDTVVGPQFEPQPLPESWIAAAGAAGVTLETTADVDAQTMGLLSSVAPELLLDLEPAQWRALSPAAAAVAMAAVPDPLDPILLAQLQAIQLAAAGETPEAQPLPEEVVAAGAAVGQTLETTADLTPELLELVAQFAPDFLSQLPAELIPAIAAESLAALPEAAVAALDSDLQQTVTNTVLAYEAFVAAQAPAVEEVAEVEPEPTPAPDPARLPEILVQGAASAGFEIEFAYDITPQFMRLFGGLGEQGIQALSLLTPDNLRALDPEVIGLLPAAYLETLDPDLRSELDALAADFGGAGAVAVTEAEEAAALAVGAPTLSGIWIEPAPGGEPSQFQTAADILDNGFLPSAAEFINIFPDSPNVQRPAQWMYDLTPDVIVWLEQNEPGFVSNLSPIVLELMAPETLRYMLDSYPEAFDEALALRLAGIAQGDVEVFVPEASITRTNGDPALVLSFFKDGDSNTVAVAERVFEKLDELTATTSLRYEIVFEQASFVEEAINGVFGEMLRGGIFAVLVILFFLSGRVRGRYRLSWRAVIIIGISIPASVLTAFVFMRWIPPLIGAPVSEWAASTNNDVIRFIAQLFPTEFTLNILTLSGLTVAIGRVVDDSIVVLENSYRYIQQGEAPLPATLKATREVAVAIFSATVATMCVFLPLGLVGGLISSFFLPFGLTVAYALAASFGVSITIVPVLIVLLIRRENIPEHREDTPMLRFYTPILKWCLNHRLVTVGVVLLLFVGSLFLLAQLPQSFLPELGEPTINAVVELPAGTRMQETDDLVRQFEERLSGRAGIVTVQSEVGGGGGVEAFFGGGNVSQNAANLSVAVEERFITEQEALGDLTAEIREDADAVFGAENVTVSAGTIASFGSGLALVLTGLPDDITLEQETALVADVKTAIGAVDLDGNGNPDVVNVTSNIDDALAGGSAPIIRIDGQPAISFGGEYEFGTSNTIGIVEEARTEITALGILPPGVEVSEGFDSQQQSEGFAGIINAIIWASVLVYLVMALSFRSLVHPFTILFSLPLSLIGAAVALFLTGRVLGISSMVGLLMLVGLVTTNGIVLMIFVKQLKDERGADTYNALLEGGRTRLRPIWMTALATILALVPLALSSEAGAIIAADLAWTVLGGMLVGTILTLVVIPVIYSLIDQGIARAKGLIGRPGASGAAGD